MPANRDFYDTLFQALENNTPSVVANVIHTQNTTSANIGDKALITETGELFGWIGGGCCVGVVKKLAQTVLTDNAPQTIRVCPEHQFVNYMPCYPSHCASEGTVDIFLEPVANEQPIVLYGQTSVAHSIAKYAENLGVAVQWYPTSGSFQADSNSPNSSNSMGNADKRIKTAIVATQGQGDVDALLHLLEHGKEDRGNDEGKNGVDHILFVASHKKAAAVINKLKQAGVSEQLTQKIMAPAGIEIGATSPAEIALSVIAKVVELKRGLSSKVAAKAASKAIQIEKPLDASNTRTQLSSCCGSKPSKGAA